MGRDRRKKYFEFVASDGKIFVVLFNFAIPLEPFLKFIFILKNSTFISKKFSIP
jgi:hypothetical protein